MATDQLLTAVLGHGAEVAGAALLEQERQEVDLEEHVAELVEHLGVVARVGGVRELVRLLDRVRDDRALVLLTVPGAVAPQAARYLVKSEQGAGGLPVHYFPVVVDGAGVGCGALPEAGALVEVDLAFGAFLQLSITKPLAQSVFDW
jgi:hypothetical protein